MSPYSEPILPQEAPTPNMRFRVLHLPRDQFVIIADRCPDDLMYNENEDGSSAMTGLSDSLVERLEGCGGCISTNRTVDMEAWYPYG